jgi:hypothetical protein
LLIKTNAKIISSIKEKEFLKKKTKREKNDFKKEGKGKLSLNFFLSISKTVFESIDLKKSSLSKDENLEWIFFKPKESCALIEGISTFLRISDITAKCIEVKIDETLNLKKYQ